jgi:hypothetical protein
MDIQIFLGLTKRSAQNLAEQNSLLFHLIRIDGEDFFSYPKEARTDRVCVEIDKGAVSKATIQ